MNQSDVHTAERARLEGKRWIQTYTGKAFHPLAPDASEVCIEDIAHALSNKCRYTGHCVPFYSVADHCVNASRLVSPAFALPALLHDAAEAYLPDIAAPIKRFVFMDVGGEQVPFSTLEGWVLDEIFHGLGLASLRQVAESDQVKKADLQMLAWELRDLMGGERGGEWGLTEPAPRSVRLESMSAASAEFEFLQRFRKLVR